MRTHTTGPLPQPGTKHSRGRHLVRVLPAPMAAVKPEDPAGMTVDVQRAWDAFWRSPLGGHVIESDLPALRRLFQMYVQREKFLDEGLENPVVQGSQRQDVVSAYLREVDVLDSKILALEDRFGMSPMSRLRLQVIVGDASKSIADTNARIAAGALDADDDEPDLRKPARRRVSGTKV